jgi:hypothetical protein
MRGVGLALAVLGLGRLAHATSCVKPDLIDSFPADGAEGVPTNATLTAHYESTAEYLNEDVTLGEGKSTPDGGANQESQPVTFNKDEGLLTVTPPNGLLAGKDYVIKWPKLRGIGTASRGRGANVSFTVGDSEDREAPTFEGLMGISWDVRRGRDDCTESLEERFVFNVTPGKATDDLGTDLLALVVFQTRGGDVGTSGASRQVLMAPLPKEGKSAEVEQPIAAATGHVCFSAQVQDLTGARSSGNGANKEVCVKTTPPPFFYGCGVTPPGRAPRRQSGAPLILGAVVLSLSRRRRHRPAP